MTAPYRLKTAGLTVNLRQEGAGKPLLFLGGSNFDLSIKAAVFASALPTRFTVAAADPRGLGASDAPVGIWSMADYAQDALDLLDALGWETADILGESFGAMTALHLAALAPDRIGRMALAVGAAGGAGGASYPIETFLDIPDPHVRARAALEVIDSRFADRMRLTPDLAQQQITDRVTAGAAFMASHNNTQGYPRLLRARARGMMLGQSCRAYPCQRLFFLDAMTAKPRQIVQKTSCVPCQMQPFIWLRAITAFALTTPNRLQRS